MIICIVVMRQDTSNCPAAFCCARLCVSRERKGIREPRTAVHPKCDQIPVNSGYSFPEPALSTFPEPALHRGLPSSAESGTAAVCGFPG